jgi:hypothetical protein
MKKLFIVASLAMLFMVGCKGKAEQAPEAVEEVAVEEVVEPVEAVADSAAVEVAPAEVQ